MTFAGREEQGNARLLEAIWLLWFPRIGPIGLHFN